jgi:hypothetical protein
MTTIRVDRIIGRQVFTTNGRRLGRLEEVRTESRSGQQVVSEYLIGSAGALQRLHLGVRLLFGLKHLNGFIARWDQLDVQRPERPRLNCPVAELRRL